MFITVSYCPQIVRRRNASLIYLFLCLIMISQLQIVSGSFQAIAVLTAIKGDIGEGIIHIEQSSEGAELSISANFSSLKSKTSYDMNIFNFGDITDRIEVSTFGSKMKTGCSLGGFTTDENGSAVKDLTVKAADVSEIVGRGIALQHSSKDGCDSSVCKFI
jgi:hypothetical protein